MSDDLHDWLFVSPDDYESDSSWEHMSVDSYLSGGADRSSATTASNAAQPSTAGTNLTGSGTTSATNHALVGLHHHHHHHSTAGSSSAGLLLSLKPPGGAHPLRPNSALSHMQQRRAKWLNQRGGMERGNRAIPKYASAKQQQPHRGGGVLMAPRGVASRRP